MQRITKQKVFVAGGAVILFLIAGFAFFHDNRKNDIEIARSLETTILPFVQENKITFYFDENWCKAVQYGSSSAVEVFGDAGAGTVPCLGNAGAFSEQDVAIFDTIRDKLNAVDGAKFRHIETEYPLTYRPEHASLSHESIGLAFGTDCGFCRVRYVYWPEYQQLPPNIEGEITYTPIDRSWYRIDQDWN
ncbi:MAG: hypothetical protein AB1861_27800 [Cyanobacteriota bacterium]